MIALIKNSGELIYFKMKTEEQERAYAKKFLEVAEETKLNLGKHGEILKKDILNLVYVDNKEKAKEFHKGTLNLLHKIFIKGDTK